MKPNYRVEKWKEVYEPNAAMLRLILVREGYRVLQWSDQPNKVYPQHSHGEDQSHWIVSGKLEVTVENYGTVVLEPGDRDFMPAHTYHTARVISDEPVLYLIGEMIAVEDVAKVKEEIEQTREVKKIMSSKAKTLGELKKSGYQMRSVKDEMRENLIKKLRKKEKLFKGILGYEESVVPGIVNAILSKHNIILLGLRGQAKSRIIRQLTEFLDDEMPIIAGSEINDNPLEPLSAYGRSQVDIHGDETKIDWVTRDNRFVEKLATPDVTIADIIGDVDPIKAAKGGHLLSDELTMHFGLLPRANRGVFAMNELPDLAGKIQVGLFNIMQEGDVQIKGYPVRLPLDVMLVFSANPEDYTARGKIITPLKDRIGAEIQTHYPKELQLGVSITNQEAWTERLGLEDHILEIPEFISEIIEQIAFEARDDQRVDKRSGVSQRFPITVLEAIVSNAERRALITEEKKLVPRISDVYSALPAMTGKMELEYEGEQIGAEKLARELIKRAAGVIFEGFFLGIDFDPTIKWFDDGNKILLSETASAEECVMLLEAVPSLIDSTITPLALDKDDQAHLVSACEFVLEGLYAQNKISRSEDGGFEATTKAKRDRRGMIYEDLTDLDSFN
jgi:magnesium chelatase subunit I